MTGFDSVLQLTKDQTATKAGRVFNMRRHEIACLILNSVRQGGTDGRKLIDVIQESCPKWGGRIPHTTDSAILGDALAGLVSNGLITISSQFENDIGKKLPLQAQKLFTMDMTFLRIYGTVAKRK